MSCKSFDIKINEVSLGKKFGQIKECDKQIINDNIQQNLFSAKFSSFYSVFTVLGHSLKNV